MLRTRVRVGNMFGKYAAMLPDAVLDIVDIASRTAQGYAQSTVPIDTGALQASIYVTNARRNEREASFARAMGRLETAKRQYIKFHRARGSGNPSVSVRGARSRFPHTMPEEMFPRRTGGARTVHSFGMPQAQLGRYQSHVIAGMWYAPFVEYPSRKKKGHFYMRRAALKLARTIGPMAHVRLAMVFR